MDYVPTDLSRIMDSLKQPKKLSLSRLKKATAPVFSSDPLALVEMTQCQHGSPCTEWQLRALALLHDTFHRDFHRRYIGQCVFCVPEFSGLFNQIHRAVAFYTSKGLSVQEALQAYLRQPTREVSHD